MRLARQDGENYYAGACSTADWRGAHLYSLKESTRVWRPLSVKVSCDMQNAMSLHLAGSDVACILHDMIVPGGKSTVDAMDK